MRRTRSPREKNNTSPRSGTYTGLLQPFCAFYCRCKSIRPGVAVMFAYYPESETTSIILANQTCNVWELHAQAEQLLLDAL